MLNMLSGSSSYCSRSSTRLLNASLKKLILPDTLTVTVAQQQFISSPSNLRVYWFDWLMTNLSLLTFSKTAKTAV